MEFQSMALDVFRFQARHCKVYKAFLSALGVAPQGVQSLHEIPFLPIEFFKQHRVVSSEAPAEIEFRSSGTGGGLTSRHFVTDLSVYRNSFMKGFRHFYGEVENFAFLALLPSYLEREGSSLIYMVDELIGHSRHPLSGYFLHDHQRLYDTLQSLQAEGTPTILLGVSYALLDFSQRYTLRFPDLIVMETGGMKGKRREMIKSEMHEILCERLGVPAIHAEYGMTELLSQAYSRGKGRYFCPPWMRVLIRDLNDPLSLLSDESTGGVNLIDLANINSCAFLATQDLGRTHAEGSFEILGRFDHSDIRGCNLMVS